MKQRTRVMHSGDDLISYDVMNNKKNDDNGRSDIQLYKIKPQEHFIEAQVQEGDTLQAIALRFYCSIAELKRINQIHKDNEIFARRTIKVPVTPYSVLTELIPSEQPEPTPSTSKQTPKSIQQLLQSNGIPQLHQSSSLQKEEKDYAIDCNAVIMNSTLASSVSPYSDVEPAEQVTEDTQLLPNKEKIPVEAIVVKELTSHGADFGLKWFHLVCFMLLLVVVIPIVYILFYLDQEHDEMDDLPPLHST